MYRHGLLMLIFSVINGISMYVFQLIMAVLLHPEQYGVLFSLTSFFSIIIVIAPAIAITLSKYTTRLLAADRADSLDYLWRHSLKRAFVIGLVLFVFLLSLSPLISRFMNLASTAYFIVITTTILVVPLYATNTGVLQGLQRFITLGISNTLQALIIVILGPVFVYAGLGILGGLVVFPTSYFIVLILTTCILHRLLRSRGGKTTISGFGSYAGNTLLTIFAITALTNIDVILARHYFSAADVGSYSAITVLGRVALFAPAGISIAMFPKTSKVFERGGNSVFIFIRAFLLVVLIVAGIVIIYSFFSPYIIAILFADKYPSIALYIPRYALAMAFFAMVTIINSFLLSLSEQRIAYILLGVCVLQVILLNIFHENISQFVNIFFVSSIVGFFSTALLLCKKILVLFKSHQ